MYIKCRGLLENYNKPKLSREKRGELSTGIILFAKNYFFPEMLNRYSTKTTRNFFHPNADSDSPYQVLDLV